MEKRREFAPGTFQVRPQGWSSLTRLRDRDDGVSLSSAAPGDPFPALISGAGREKTGLVSDKSDVSGVQQGGAVAPFVSVVSKGVQQQRVVFPSLYGGGGGRQTSSGQDVVVGRLREQHGWADELFIRDILRAVDGDEDVASAQLHSMAPPSDLEKSSDNLPAGFVTNSWNAGSLDVGATLADGLHSGYSTLHGASVNGDIGSPECEDNDVYLKFRKEALRMSRARDRYARGAYNAFMAGDHSLAKHLSREARENWKNAENLHAQAAEEILLVRNSDGLANIWSLDLHGLHAAEAVMALQQRLAHLEGELARNPSLIYGHNQREADRSLELKGEGSGAKLQDVGHENLSLLAAPRSLVKKDLSVITGVGRHSKGGPSLPSAVKNFLLSHGYKFNDARSGVVAVTPKRHYV